MNSSGFSSASSSFMDSSIDQSDSEAARLDLTSPNSVSTLSFSNPSSVTSSVPNTDDEEDDNDKPVSCREKRRERHTLAEKRRRDNIKKGYDELQLLVPEVHSDTIGSQKVSKAVILRKSITYIEYLEKEKRKQIEDLEKLRKEKMALTIMKSNYEQIVKAHQSNPVNSATQVSEQVKFEVFQRIMDALFHTFNSSISVASFQELSHCVISWVEEQCTPQSLRDIVLNTLKQLNHHLR